MVTAPRSLAPRDDRVALAARFEDQRAARPARHLSEERRALGRAHLLVAHHREGHGEPFEQPRAAQRFEREGHHHEAALHVEHAGAPRDLSLDGEPREGLARKHRVDVAHDHHAGVARRTLVVKEEVVAEALAPRDLAVERHGLA